MLHPLTLSYLLLVVSTWMTIADANDVAQFFSRPVMARLYESGQYALANSHRKTGNRVEASQFASALAGLKPSYVSGVLRFSSNTDLTTTMIHDFNITRNAVLAASPNAKFDLEINLNPKGPQAFSDAKALTEFMAKLDDKLQPDGWWFDFYSNAQESKPEWVSAAVRYAHKRNQTIGGNVFGGSVPPGSDAVSFVDWPAKSSPYGQGVDQNSFGFGIAPKQVAHLKKSSPSTIILGHLNCNPQNGDSTESCMYINTWNTTTRVNYLDYWLSQQAPLGFTYFYPVFFPLCPGAFSFDPLSDFLSAPVAAELSKTGSSGNTFYDYIKHKASGGSSSNSGTTSHSGAQRTACAVSTVTITVATTVASCLLGHWW